MTNIKKETNETLDQKPSFLEKILSSKLYDNNEQEGFRTKVLQDRSNMEGWSLGKSPESCTKWCLCI